MARLHARPLDRGRPLWELYLISGLSGGRAAIYSKIHHAAIDGVSGGDILTALLDASPQGRELPPVEVFEGERPPDPTWLLARSAVALAFSRCTPRVATDLARSIPVIANAIGPPLAQRLAGRDSTDLLSQTGLLAPVTPFNAPLSPRRRWAFADLPLAEVKQLRKSHGAEGLTVNDVVMALCAGALRRWLELHDALPAAPLVAAVPVSVRTQDQQGTYGNRMSMMLAALPTNLPDPGDRLDAMHEAMRAAKDQHGAIPASLLADVGQFALPALANQAWRLSARLRLLERVSPFNLIVSNIPGPRVPLYLAGAQLLAFYPVSALVDGQGLNITVMSYRDNLHFGLIACSDLVPDLDVMAGYLCDELDASRRQPIPPGSPVARRGVDRLASRGMSVWGRWSTGMQTLEVSGPGGGSWPGRRSEPPSRARDRHRQPGAPSGRRRVGVALHARGGGPVRHAQACSTRSALSPSPSSSRS